MNIALYGRPGQRWAMTERGADAVSRAQDVLQIGPSAMRWEDGRCIVELREIAFPFIRPLRGRVTLEPKALNGADFALDELGCHRWWPIAPCARIRVEMDTPSLTWEGSGYLDSNRGSEPLEKGFQGWDWSRNERANGDTVVYYDLTRRDGSPYGISHEFCTDGSEHSIPAPPKARMPNILWQVPRVTRSDAGRGAKVIRTLEDTPFYSRSKVETVLEGQRTEGVHESLDLRRFDSAWVKLLLPFRMPRRG